MKLKESSKIDTGGSRKTINSDYMLECANAWYQNQNDSCIACGYCIVNVMAQDILSHLYGYN